VQIKVSADAVEGHRPTRVVGSIPAIWRSNAISHGTSFNSTVVSRPVRGFARKWGSERLAQREVILTSGKLTSYLPCLTVASESCCMRFFTTCRVSLASFHFLWIFSYRVEHRPPGSLPVMRIPYSFENLIV